MSKTAPLVEIWRGEMLESAHSGYAVVCHSDGSIVEAWGDPEALIYPRSSCKMLQALPLIESGAADAFEFSPEELALACASHQGAAIHTDRVAQRLDLLDLSERDLLCGVQTPSDTVARDALICGGQPANQMHNNCSGKHVGFLALSKHIGAGPDYVAPDHPIQVMIRTAFEDMTDMVSPGFGIDGCSAPNFATSIAGLARGVAMMTRGGSDQRAKASKRLIEAMVLHPDLVAGEGRACTELMRAMGGKAAIKTGAEGVFVAILPEARLGIAVKIVDGATRAAECAIAALLVRYGVLDAAHPSAVKRLSGPITNWRGLETGQMRLASGFAQAPRLV